MGKESQGVSLQDREQLELALNLDKDNESVRHHEWGNMLVELLAQFGYDDFDLLAVSLYRILYHHFRRVGKFNKALITGFPLENTDLKDEDIHRRCTFGQWYYSQNASELTQNSEFIEFGKLHENFHICMRKLIVQAEGGKSISPDDYEYFLQAYNRFADKLAGIINQINFAQFQFDHLTNLLNRRAFNKILEYEHNRLQRHRRPCCVAMADIDHFKRINDVHGHKSGDMVLKKIAICSQELMRSNDTVGRYGGEELIFCLPDTTLDTAESVMNRLRKKVENLRIELNTKEAVTVTLSFGIAELHEKNSVSDSIENADKALYEAKSSGRNQIVIWDERQKDLRNAYIS